MCFIDGLFGLILCSLCGMGELEWSAVGWPSSLGQWRRSSCLFRGPGNDHSNVSAVLAGNQHAQRPIERHSSIHSCANQTQDSGY